MLVCLVNTTVVCNKGQSSLRLGEIVRDLFNARIESQGLRKTVGGDLLARGFTLNDTSQPRLPCILAMTNADAICADLLYGQRAKVLTQEELLRTNGSS